MGDDHTSQHLDANLGDKDTRDCCLELSPQGIYSKRETDEIVKNLPNVFGIAGDILVVGYDIAGKDHDGTI